MSTAMRITVKRGKWNRTFVVVAPPYPSVGDVCTIQGVDWEVTRIKETDALSISFPQAKATKVFPANGAGESDLSVEVEANVILTWDAILRGPKRDDK